MELPKISVVIPVYNVEQYLRMCLSSLCKQTLADIEIICVNDCSTDKCLDILLEFAKVDERVKVINNEVNIGQGLSRNKGIQMAKGEYIGFIDSDDWVDTEMYEHMYTKASQSAFPDIIGCDYRYEDEHGTLLRFDTNPYSDDVELRTNILKRSFGERKGDPNRGGFASSRSCCTKLYKASFLKQSGVAFQSEKEIYSEDWLFNAQLLLKSHSIAWVHQPFYHYIKRQTSFMNVYRPQYLDRRIAFQSKLKQILERSDVAFREELLLRMDMDLFLFAFAYVANEAKLGLRAVWRSIVYLSNVPEMSRLFRQFHTDEMTYYNDIKKDILKYIVYWCVRLHTFGSK